MTSFWDVHGRLNRRDERASPATEAAEGAGRARPGESGREALSVTQLTARIKTALDKGLPSTIAVVGEVSEWTRAPSGHRYFCLKDERASINCVMWQSDARSLAFEPTVGQELIAIGALDVYGPRGQYQLRCRRLEPSGQGARDLALRQLTERLRAEGLFDPSRKRPLPQYPQNVAIVTSPKAAGYQDVLKVLRRHRHLRLMLCPVPVQGEGAAERIAAALSVLSRQHEDVGGIDVVLLVRGGGSAEDLWAFNEEPVARAVAGMSVPVITGIGHQTDRTLADLAADVEAHTPTEAAQVLVRHWKNAPDRLEHLGIALRRNWRDLQRERREIVRAALRHEMFRRPVEGVNRRRQRVDELSFALARAIRRLARETGERLREWGRILESRHPRQRVALDRRHIAEFEGRLKASWVGLRSARAAGLVEARRKLDGAMRAALASRRQRSRTLEMALFRHSPEGQARLMRQRLAALGDRLARAGEQNHRHARSSLSAMEGRLRALDPTAVLRRGYSLTVVSRTGSLLRSASDARPGDELVTRTADGEVRSTVGERRQAELFE